MLLQGAEPPHPLTRDSEGSCGLDIDPLAEHLWHPAVIDANWSLASHDQSPAFELVPANCAISRDRMLAVALRLLIHDHAEIVAALGAFSGRGTLAWWRTLIAAPKGESTVLRLRIFLLISAYQPCPETATCISGPQI